MKSNKVLVTCPPMLANLEQFTNFSENLNISLCPVKTNQTLTEDELIKLLPNYDGWIIGDDPATFKVLNAGKKGNLKASVKWGVGTDNIDFDAFKKLGIKITNTPGMFNSEVADMALGYLIALARNTFEIDRQIRSGLWPKPSGISLKSKKCGILGFGNIGQSTAKRLLASEMDVIAYDPLLKSKNKESSIAYEQWPKRLNELDFLIITCSLTSSSFHLLDTKAFKYMKKGISLINVGRGPIIEESALVDALNKGIVKSAALDVFEEEPLPLNSKLRNFESCIFGSHNSSNTIDAVIKTSEKAIIKISEFLENPKI